MYLAVENWDDGGGRFAAVFPRGFFTEHELLAAERWRNVYLTYLRTIVEDYPDHVCESAKSKYMEGLEILESQDLSERYCKRKRVVHAVNAVCVYGEPDELGDANFVLSAAKVGFADLARNNF